MNEIRIAIYGQFDNDTKFDFTYPDDFNAASVSQKDAWLRSISDPRDGREFKAERLYTIWRNNEGNYYGVIVPNRRDSRNGYILLTLFLGKQLPASGQTIIAALAKLEEMLITEGVRDKEAVRQYMNTIAGQFTPDNSLPMPAQKVQTRAYRVYQDERELADLLLYPIQQEYAPYSRILFIPKSAAPATPPQSYTELRNVIRHTYTVLCPDGVKVDKRTISDGSTLEVTYMKGGYPPSRYRIQVTAPTSRLYAIEGNVLRVKSADEAGVSFTRRVRLNICSDKSGQPIGMFTINGETKKHGDELALPDSEVLEFNISANGFSQRTMRVHISEIMKNNYELKAYLKPQEKGLRVIATTVVNGSEKRIEGEVKVTPDDKLYPFLSDSRNYELKIVRRKGAAAGTGGSKNQPNGNGLSPLVKMAIGAVAGLVIGFILATVLAPSAEKDDDEPDPKPNNSLIDKPQKPDMETDNDVEPDPQQIQFENDDKDYLKKGEKDASGREIWKKEKIQSKKYQELFQYFEEGNLEKIINHAYNTAEKKNEFFTKTSDALKKIDEGGDREKMDKSEELIKILSTNGVCQIQEICSELAAGNVAKNADKSVDADKKVDLSKIKDGKAKDKAEVTKTKVKDKTNLWGDNGE